MKFRNMLGASVALAVLTLSPFAGADTVGKNQRGFTAVGKGVKEIGFDNLFLVRYHSAPLTEAPDTTVSNTNIAYVGGLTPRYFVTNNLALALNLDYFYRSDTTKSESEDATTGDPVTTEETATDQGFIGFLMANYYMRLGSGMFFKPGIGGGGFVGSRRRPTPGQVGQETKTSLTGGAGRLDLGFAFYASENINLKAGIDAIMRFGTEKPEDDATATGGQEAESQSFTTVDAGFNIGIAYSF